MKQHKSFIPSTLLALTWLCLGSQTTHGSQSSSSMLETSSALVTASSESKKSAKAKHLVVFDIGGVLLNHSIPSITWQTGPLSLTWSFLRDPMAVIYMRRKLDEALNAVYSEAAPFFAPGDDKGNKMSRIFMEREAGIISSEEALKKIRASITKLTEEKKFSNACATAVTKLAEVIYTPEIFAGCMKPIAAGVELVKLCAANPDNELAILSNLGTGIIEKMKKLYPEVFKYFKPENIITSGDISEADKKKLFSTPYHVVKGDNPEIFNYAAQRLGYAPDQIIFIDDMAINVQTAQSCKWEALQVKNGDFETVKQTLQKCGLILCENSTASTTLNNNTTALVTYAVTTAQHSQNPVATLSPHFPIQ